VVVHWCSGTGADEVQRCGGVQILRCRCGAEEVQVQLCSGADIEVVGAGVEVVKRCRGTEV
jgi:hypothetical protein